LLATTYLLDEAYPQVAAVLTGTNRNDTPVWNFS
jgi:hypothetical protein